MKTTLLLVGLLGSWLSSSAIASVDESRTKVEITWPGGTDESGDPKFTFSLSPSDTLTLNSDRGDSGKFSCSFSWAIETTCTSCCGHGGMPSGTLSLSNFVLSVHNSPNTLTGQPGVSAQDAVSSSRRRVFRMVKINGKKRMLVIETDWRGMYGFVGLADSGLTDDEALAAHQWLVLHREGHSYPMDAESKGRVLVGEVTKTVALANQICREITVSDHGIDLEIEFKDDRGEASGVCVKAQLKSGDSHLEHVKSRGGEKFQIRDERHARYWRNQATPVMLVIRKSTGETRWMEIRDYLKARHEPGKGDVKAIEFTGERFDVASVRRLRDQMLAADSPIV